MSNKEITEHELTLMLAFARKDADNKRTNAAYGGAMHDGGARRIEEIVNAFEAGMSGRIPSTLIEYYKEAVRQSDPEYKDYLRLKKKFD